MSASPADSRGRPFGQVLYAMVTPFGADGALDLAKAEQLAAYLAAGLALDPAQASSAQVAEASPAQPRHQPPGPGPREPDPLTALGADR